MARISAKEFARAVTFQDLKTLTRLPGIGKKSAERILVEVKGKVQSLSAPSEYQPAPIHTTTQDDAADALEALGYTTAEIYAALEKAPKNSTTEKVIKMVETNDCSISGYVNLPGEELDELEKKLSDEAVGWASDGVYGRQFNVAVDIVDVVNQKLCNRPENVEIYKAKFIVYIGVDEEYTYGPKGCRRKYNSIAALDELEQIFLSYGAVRIEKYY